MNLQNSSAFADIWYLHAHINFLQNYDIYLRRADGRIEHLESHGLDTTFGLRSVEFPELITEFSFSPEEKIELYIHYWSGGSSKISVSLETAEGFSKKSITQISKNFTSYGMMLILIIAALLALILLRRRVFLDYSIYVLVTLIFLMHSDGAAFQYFWPNHPRFNSYFSIIVGLAFAVVPYNFARTFLRTKIFHPRLDRLMVWIMIFTPLFIIPSAFIDPQFTKKLLVALVFLSIVIGTFSGLIASVKRFKEVRFYLFAWILGVLSAGIMMMGLGVADRYRQQVKAARDEQNRALEQAELNLQLNNRLLDLEEKYTLAAELSTSRDEGLQNIIHDIRQPIHALRVNLKNLQNGDDLGVVETDKFEETFTYLEGIISGFLENSIVEPSIDSATVKARSQNASDLNLNQILGSIHDMFLPDAIEKNIEFRYIETGQTTRVEPLVLMRIVSNLISNAIKYTPSGKIILCVRTLGGQTRIEVHDTGLGMSDLVRLKRYRSGTSIALILPQM